MNRKMGTPLFYVLVVTLFVQIDSVQFDYYWKDLNGEIPQDAISAGLDRNNEPIYIAQVILPEHGVLVGGLHHGSSSVTVSKAGVHSTDRFIKILCSGKPEKLSWVPSDGATIHVANVGKHMVVGGTENDRILNIGRKRYYGEVILGKVCGYDIENALMYFPYEGEEQSSNFYEVLVYTDE